MQRNPKLFPVNISLPAFLWHFPFSDFHKYLQTTKSPQTLMFADFSLVPSLWHLTPRVGLEPTTTRLTAECSTIELSRTIPPHAGCHHWRHWPYMVQGHYCTLKTEHWLNNHAILPCFWSSYRPISTGQLCTLLCLHSPPTYLVVLKWPYWISHLGGGFTLRCLQRLSLPGLATLP